MRTTTRSRLDLLVENVSNIRNVCILAHVDHGKTTLADTLLAMNGIISMRQAGKLRYMDNLAEEQERGITMKSSAVSLLFEEEEPVSDKRHQSSESGCDNPVPKQTYLINLIDSPGHVDFCSEVSTAVRLCDGAILVVDVVEGVCPQTRTVLRQAWEERLKLVLVVNKLDRLHMELQLTPQQAYRQIVNVIQQVNSVIAELFSSEVMQRQYASRGQDQVRNTDGFSVSEWSSGLDQTDDEHLYFAPERGNVVFASSWDTWGFRVSDFAHIYARKLNLPSSVLQQSLWGDWYMTSEKKIAPGAAAKNKRPLFVQLVLEQLWNLYQTVAVDGNRERASQMSTSLGITLAVRDLRQTDNRALLRLIGSQWLPLGRAVLSAVVQYCSSPDTSMTKEKVERLIWGPRSGSRAQFVEATEALMACRSDDTAPLLVYISKVVPLETTAITSNGYKDLSPEELSARRAQARQSNAAMLAERCRVQNGATPVMAEGVGHLQPAASDVETEGKPEPSADEFVAFGRVFSGRVMPGQRVFILGPKFNPAKVPPEMTTLDPATLPLGPLSGVKQVEVGQVTTVGQFIGRELHPLPNGMPAGNVMGVAGLSGQIRKTATVVRSLAGAPLFAGLIAPMAPVVCVAVEPSLASDLARLEKGLSLLEKADPSVEVEVSPTGETLIHAAGEIHLQKCLAELTSRYAPGIQLHVSPFIVPFRETVTTPSEASVCHVRLAHRAEFRLGLRVTARPLPPVLVDWMETEAAALLRVVIKSNKHQQDPVAHQDFDLDLARALSSATNNDPDKFQWSTLTDRVWCFGPDNAGGANILVNQMPSEARFLHRAPWRSISTSVTTADDIQSRSYSNALLRGFQLAVGCGPLCGEPMRGVAFFLEDIYEEQETSSSPTHQSDEEEDSEEDKRGVTSWRRTGRGWEACLLDVNPGQLTSAMSRACHQAFQSSSGQRLMLAMYTVDLQARSEVLGKMYAVLSRRHGHVLHEEMREGENVFVVRALVPVMESFGLGDELRKRTSGMISLPQMCLSHWDVLDADPTTTMAQTQEAEDEGTDTSVINRAVRYMNLVRRRKGLPVREQLVGSGDKQRTLSKKK